MSTFNVRYNQNQPKRARAPAAIQKPAETRLPTDGSDEQDALVKLDILLKEANDRLLKMAADRVESQTPAEELFSAALQARGESESELTANIDDAVRKTKPKRLFIPQEIVRNNKSAHLKKQTCFLLLEDSAFFTKQLRSVCGQLSYNFSGFNERMALTAMRALVSDFLFQACPWHHSYNPSWKTVLCETPRFNKIMEAFLPESDINVKVFGRHSETINLRYWVMAEIIDPMREKIQQRVHQFLNGPGWNVYIVDNIPNGLLIGTGTDFRILDWERIMEQERWGC